MGRRVFITTPNRRFPVEVHTRLPFVHWLPDRTAHRVYRAVGKPNEVTVSHDFVRISKAKAFVGSPRLREIMKSAGVKGTPTIWFVKPA